MIQEEQKDESKNQGNTSGVSCGGGSDRSFSLASRRRCMDFLDLVASGPFYGNDCNAADRKTF